MNDITSRIYENSNLQFRTHKIFWRNENLMQQTYVFDFILLLNLD